MSINAVQNKINKYIALKGFAYLPRICTRKKYMKKEK